MLRERQKNKAAAPELVRSAELRIGAASLYTGNIILFSFHDDIMITREDVIGMSDITVSFVGTAPYFTVILPGYRNDVSKEAREFDFHKELGREPVCIAEAVIVKDLPTRIVVDFYYRFRKFPYPTKVFSRQEKVYAWFRQFKPMI